MNQHREDRNVASVATNVMSIFFPFLLKCEKGDGNWKEYYDTKNRTNQRLYAFACDVVCFLVPRPTSWTLFVFL